MMKTMKVLAIDIGASSGKLVKAELKNNRLESETVYRFENRQITLSGHLCWDIDYLFEEILKGLEAAKEADFITIDTWGVDFVLLDKAGKRLTPAVAYRDKRTENVVCPISQEELYSRTGIQYQKFNTIYQLLALREEEPEVLEKAESFLFVPDYLCYLLTGEMVQEYTNATTSNLVAAGKTEWDYGLVEKLGLPLKLFKKLSMSGTKVGKVKAEIAHRIGYCPTFILAPTHDTASAVLASPLGPHSLFLSSGTWSLLGCICPTAVTDKKALKANLTNEGTDDGKIRLLKNIMGTWMLQNVRKENNDIPFSEIEKQAQESRLVGLIDPMSERFLAPPSMCEEVALAIEEQGLERPKTLGETALVIYHSLASAYKRAIEELEEITGQTFDHLAIVGGGTKDGFLNSLTKEYTGLRITTGPTEGSATGAILSALIHTGAMERKDIVPLLSSSFDIKTI